MAWVKGKDDELLRCCSSRLTVPSHKPPPLLGHWLCDGYSWQISWSH